jgi:uncharacterized protein (UPF0332 family)
VKGARAPKALLDKAARSAASARLLLKYDDPEGASNRAYYAMFDAARAALTAQGHELPKTHRGLISAFSLHLVKEGLLPVEYSRDLNDAERLRLTADYQGDPLEPETVSETVEKAERFVAGIQKWLISNREPKKIPRTKLPNRRR